MKKILCFLCLCWGLTGCVPLIIGSVVTVGVIVTVVIVDDHRTPAVKASDHALSQAVEKQLGSDVSLQGCHIRVAVFDGIVLLVGQAQTVALKEHAQVLVAKVPGIARLYNEIEIASPSSELSRMSDDWLSGKVKTALLAAHYVHSGSLAVVVSNGVVYLIGKVTEGDANLAEHTASQVGGVQKVVSALIVVPNSA